MKQEALVIFEDLIVAIGELIESNLIDDETFSTECEPPIIYIWRSTIKELLLSPSSGDDAMGKECEYASHQQQLVQYVSDLFWNRLHAVYYKDVSRNVRVGYNFSISLLGCVHWHCGSVRDAIRCFDNAIVMVDAPLIKTRLINAIDHLQFSVLTPVIDVPDNLEIKFAVENPVSSFKYPVQSLSMAEIQQSLTMPFVVRGATAEWDATRKWKDLKYFLELMGPDRLIPVEIGSKYTSAEWTQSLMTVSDFANRFLFAEDGDGIGYLAQHDLLDQMPRLKQEIEIPEICRATKSKDTPVIINAWIGPKGTVSPLHTDPHDNMFAQIVGWKYLRLYAPEMSESLYPYTEEGTLMTNTSQVDVECPNLTKYPLFEHATYSDVIVGPGDLLFIPKGYWHFVKSYSTSISLSFWF